jgi:hypothetical protein
MTTYDLNIWDKLSYETSGKEQGGWVIGVYEIPEDQAPYGSGILKEDLTITLTEQEAKDLTLGVSAQEGGRYSPDEDFWMDSETFLSVYEGLVSPRIQSLIWALPDY